jgi:virginiamycin A acetyltransferase
LQPRSDNLNRSMLREGILMAAIALTAPCWLPALLHKLATGGTGLFTLFAELLSLVPGLPGVLLRRGYYRMCLDSYARDASIGFGTTLAHPQVRIGKGVYIGNRCSVGLAVIGDHATIGSNVDILSGRRQHHFGLSEKPVQLQGGAFQQVTIGSNCWIGNSAVVMADVGDHSVIGAGSVVVDPIPARSVAVGNPAVVKKTIAQGVLLPSPGTPGEGSGVRAA